MQCETVHVTEMTVFGHPSPPRMSLVPSIAAVCCATLYKTTDRVISHMSPDKPAGKLLTCLNPRGLAGSNVLIASSMQIKGGRSGRSGYISSSVIRQRILRSFHVRFIERLEDRVFTNSVNTACLWTMNQLRLGSALLLVSSICTLQVSWAFYILDTIEPVKAWD